MKLLRYVKLGNGEIIDTKEKEVRIGEVFFSIDGYGYLITDVAGTADTIWGLVEEGWLSCSSTIGKNTRELDEAHVA